jgi:formate/nitrite transporter
MGMYSPNEVIDNYIQFRTERSGMPAARINFLAMIAGFIIAAGAAVTMVATYTIQNPSVVRIISGLLFPMGLAMITILKAELFTGNCLMIMNVMGKKMSIGRMLFSWFQAYFWNYIGAMLFTILFCHEIGKLRPNPELAQYIISVGITKMNISFSGGVYLGIACNIFVCMGVFCAAAGKDLPSKVIGSYLPVLFFIICGFEHSIANMFFAPAAVILESEKASGFTILKAIAPNLIPVTIGNIIGGCLFGSIMFGCYKKAP